MITAERKKLIRQVWAEYRDTAKLGPEHGATYVAAYYEPVKTCPPKPQEEPNSTVPTLTFQLQRQWPYWCVVCEGVVVEHGIYSSRSVVTGKSQLQL